MNRGHPSRAPRARAIRLVLSLALSACGGDDRDETAADAAAAAADADPSRADAAARPALTCDPATAALDDLCGCMADIVCDQIYFCLDAGEIAARPADWSPRASCVEILETDCLDDLDSDPVDYFPADFRACVADLGAATCDDFGDFTSVSDDFPASCENLRALDTALGLDL